MEYTTILSKLFFVPAAYCLTLLYYLLQKKKIQNHNQVILAPFFGFILYDFMNSFSRDYSFLNAGALTVGMILTMVFKNAIIKPNKKINKL